MTTLNMTRRRWRLLSTLDRNGPLTACGITELVSASFPRGGPVRGARGAEAWGRRYAEVLVREGLLDRSAGQNGVAYAITDKGRAELHQELDLPLFKTVA